MASKKDQEKIVQQALAWFLGLPWQGKLLVLAVIGIGLLILYFSPTSAPRTSGPLPERLNRDHFLFCWWNLENFFDDKIDGWKGPEVDVEYDRWFAANPDMVQLKLDHLSQALLPLNGGIGPDILACCEVEDSPDPKRTPGALILLRDRLNAGIADPDLHYREILWKRMPGGRNIANAILTRLPVDPDRTRLVHGTERILEGVIRVRDHDLIVIASHWTSRLTDKTGRRRAEYADAIYDHIRELYQRDPNVPVILAGDFNDSPEEPSVVTNLRATTDRNRVLASRNELLLYNLMRQPQLAGQGTIQGRGSELETFDQIVVTPGMLRPGGWTVDPDSVAIITEGTTYLPRRATRPRPLRFGSPNEKGQRGTSDHLPVTVTLHLPLPPRPEEPPAKTAP